MTAINRVFTPSRGFEKFSHIEFYSDVMESDRLDMCGRVLAVTMETCPAGSLDYYAENGIFSLVWMAAPLSFNYQFDVALIEREASRGGFQCCDAWFQADVLGDVIEAAEGARVTLFVKHRDWTKRQTLAYHIAVASMARAFGVRLINPPMELEVLYEARTHQIYKESDGRPIGSSHRSGS